MIGECWCGDMLHGLLAFVGSMSVGVVISLHDSSSGYLVATFLCMLVVCCRV